MSAEGTLRDGQPAGFELIETLRWEPADGFIRLPLHLARLQASAEALGFAHDAEAVADALSRSAGGDQRLRVRLVMGGDGACHVTTQIFTPFTPGTEWKLRIAGTRLDSGDGLLRHKTSLRGRYEAARAEFSTNEADEVVLLNERGEICEGAITTIFLRRDGAWLTPALSCGLLAGVLREDMLRGGIAREAILTQDDLSSGELAVGNSLRGLIPARLA